MHQTAAPEAWADVIVVLLFILVPFGIVSMLVNAFGLGYGWLREHAVSLGFTVGAVLLVMGGLLQLSEYYGLSGAEDADTIGGIAYHRAEGITAFIVGAASISLSTVRLRAERRHEHHRAAVAHRAGRPTW